MGSGLPYICNSDTEIICILNEKLHIKVDFALYYVCQILRNLGLRRLYVFCLLAEA